MITIEYALEESQMGIPVKVFPDMMKCYQCMDYIIEHDEDDMDCEACNKNGYRYGYLKKTEHKLLSSYGLVIFEDGKIERVPLDRIRVIDVPKVKR